MANFDDFCLISDSKSANFHLVAQYPVLLYRKEKSIGEVISFCGKALGRSKHDLLRNVDFQDEPIVDRKPRFSRKN